MLVIGLTAVEKIKITTVPKQICEIILFSLSVKPTMIEKSKHVVKKSIISSGYSLKSNPSIVSDNKAQTQLGDFEFSLRVHKFKLELKVTNLTCLHKYVKDNQNRVITPETRIDI